MSSTWVKCGPIDINSTTLIDGIQYRIRLNYISPGKDMFVMSVFPSLVPFMGNSALQSGLSPRGTFTASLRFRKSSPQIALFLVGGVGAGGGALYETFS